MLKETTTGSLEAITADVLTETPIATSTFINNEAGNNQFLIYF